MPILPLKLKMEDTEDAIHAPSKILNLAMKDPALFEGKLKDNRNNFKHQMQKSREEFAHEKKGLIYANRVEARFFMHPKHMDKCQIVSYHAKPPRQGYQDC